MQTVKKNDVIQVRIDDLAYGGLGVGRVDGYVVFVEKAIPGELVSARIHKRKKNHAQGVIVSIDEPSPHRVHDPRCRLFGACGGCGMQHLPYDQQLVWKEKQAADVLKHLGGQTGYQLLPIIGSPDPWHYRNKMEYSFSLGDDGQAILGFHYPKTFDRIFDVDRCHIHPEPYDVMLRVLREYAREQKLSCYNPRSHRGFLRHAVMRHSHTTGESILVLITHKGELPECEALAARLAAETPGFKGFVWGENSGLADVARIERRRWEWGEPKLTETINGLTFTISPEAFFQTNTRGAEILYAKVVETAGLEPSDVLLDAYCGMGAIGLHAAKSVRHVVGIELVTEAIWDARRNAVANGIDNTTFIASPMATGLDLVNQAIHEKFTCVVIDPPRGGMDKKSLTRLIDLRAPVFIYVSCNPATLARDLQTIAEGGYVIETVQPVDMFPHTTHIETIVRMRRVQ